MMTHKLGALLLAVGFALALLAGVGVSEVQAQAGTPTPPPPTSTSTQVPVYLTPPPPTVGAGSSGGWGTAWPTTQPVPTSDGSDCPACSAYGAGYVYDPVYTQACAVCFLRCMRATSSIPTSTAAIPTWVIPTWPAPNGATNTPGPSPTRSPTLPATLTPMGCGVGDFCTASPTPTLTPGGPTLTPTRSPTASPTPTGAYVYPDYVVSYSGNVVNPGYAAGGPDAFSSELWVDGPTNQQYDILILGWSLGVKVQDHGAYNYVANWTKTANDPWGCMDIYDATLGAWVAGSCGPDPWFQGGVIQTGHTYTMIRFSLTSYQSKVKHWFVESAGLWGIPGAVPSPTPTPTNTPTQTPTPTPTARPGEAGYCRNPVLGAPGVPIVGGGVITWYPGGCQPVSLSLFVSLSFLRSILSPIMDVSWIGDLNVQGLNLCFTFFTTQPVQIGDFSIDFNGLAGLLAGMVIYALVFRL